MVTEASANGKFGAEQVGVGLVCGGRLYPPCAQEARILPNDRILLLGNTSVNTKLPLKDG